MKNKQGTKQENPRIISSLFTDNDQIVGMVIKDVVKAVGSSGCIFLPKELRGKYVQIKLEVLQEKTTLSEENYKGGEEESVTNDANSDRLEAQENENN
jgi:putative transposon-encoded protein